ncbi:hypothetical protein A4D02_19905 [Niastella koreensis]|uniref:Uncharacterized protein n=2 Tax=Niastella koreensis TaxID=354356 RepID=G8TIT3_NIAKG|nr:hypothetical protein [Niastella koreensis]AEV96427.1 hypothetical protein Niako_0025 [Niastella koreensis GR20-10]OQP53958.1 hypothetical protein A4D02_19905 [Niastella koreensis]
MSNNFTKITIKDNEMFNPLNFPNAISELAALRSGVSDAPIYFKVEIIVSYLKNHTLSISWIDANPVLTRMVTSGFFKTSHLESIFESGRYNNIFLRDFERYITKQLLT